MTDLKDVPHRIRIPTKESCRNDRFLPHEHMPDGRVFLYLDEARAALRAVTPRRRR
jgi:hypothetical protein